MKKNVILSIILAIDFFLLLFETSTISISYHEAYIFFGKYEIVSYLAHFFTSFFGQNDYTLRIGMILLHLGSVILVYILSKDYVETFKERLIVVGIFILLPGVVSSALILDSAGFLIFAVLLFIYLFKKYNYSFITYIYLALLTFLDNGFFYLYLSLLVFSIYYKKKEFIIFNSVLLTINIILFGIDIGGYPKGHFLDTLGIYAAIFSPIVFVYLVYALYRYFLTSKKLDIAWFIASVTLLYSLLLSLRQQIHVENYAPFVMMGIFHAAKIFRNSYKVRLKNFRKQYKILFNISLFFLLLNFIAVLSNKTLYYFLKDPKMHFAYKQHIAKEVAIFLKQNHIKCIHTDYKMQLRLAFYGIKDCQNYLLDTKLSSKSLNNVTIRYDGKILYKAYVTKLNNK